MKDSRRTAVSAEDVGTHGRHGSIVGGLDDAYGLYGKNEIGCRQGVEYVAVDVRRVDPDGRIVPSDDSPERYQPAPPPAVHVVRHQRDEHRHGFAQRRLVRRSVECAEFHCRGERTQSIDAGQPGNRRQPHGVSRQPCTNQPPGGTNNLDASTLEDLGQFGWARIIRQSYPAERPVSSGVDCLGHQDVNGVRGAEPVEPVVDRFRLSRIRTFDPFFGHLAVEPYDGIAFGWLWRPLGR